MMSGWRCTMPVPPDGVWRRTTWKLLMPSGPPTARIRRAPGDYGRRPCNGRTPERLTRGRRDISPGMAMGGVKSPAGSRDDESGPQSLGGDRSRATRSGAALGATLRTSPASVTASPLCQVDVAAARGKCLATVEAAVRCWFDFCFIRPEYLMCCASACCIKELRQASAHSLLAQGQKRVRSAAVRQPPACCFRTEPICIGWLPAQSTPPCSQ